LLFKLNLLPVIQVLQAAAAAAGKMLATWVYTGRGRLNNFCNTGLIIVALAIGVAKFDSFLRQSTLNKAGLAINAPHAPAIMAEVDYLATDNFFFGHAVAVCVY
jgi:hypothetical protein